MVEEIPEVQKKRGWPKGKPRGPRKPRAEEPASMPPPSPPRAPAASYEPVSASGVMKNGTKFSLRAIAFEREAGQWVFVSYPETRGFKTLTIYRLDELASISITAPERDFEGLKAPAPVQSYTGDPAPQQSYVRGVPAASVPDYAGGDPRRAADPRANKAERVPRTDGAPIPQSAVVGEDGRKIIVGATMQ